MRRGPVSGRKRGLRGALSCLRQAAHARRHASRAELADRPVDETASCPPDYAGTNRRPYKSLIPLPELLGELLGVGSGSKKVAAAYGALVERAGSEFALLLDQSEAEIETLGTAGVPGELLAMAVGRMRSGQLHKTRVRRRVRRHYAFAPGERIGVKAGAGLFDDEVGTGEEETPPPDKAQASTPAASEPAGGKKDATPPATSAKAPKTASESGTGAFGLDPAQEAAVNHPGGPASSWRGPARARPPYLRCASPASSKGARSFIDFGDHLHEQGGGGTPRTHRGDHRRGAGRAAYGSDLPLVLPVGAEGACGRSVSTTRFRRSR